MKNTDWNQAWDWIRTRRVFLTSAGLGVQNKILYFTIHDNSEQFSPGKHSIGSDCRRADVGRNARYRLVRILCSQCFPTDAIAHLDTVTDDYYHGCSYQKNGLRHSNVWNGCSVSSLSTRRGRKTQKTVFYVSAVTFNMKFERVVYIRNRVKHIWNRSVSVCSVQYRSPRPIVKHYSIPVF